MQAEIQSQASLLRKSLAATSSVRLKAQLKIIQ